MDLRHLQYFVTLSDTLNFTRASRVLHVTQSTLSHQIMTLESRLGTDLFERAGRSIRLTPAGRIFKEHALRALKEMSSARTAIVELSGLLQGTLKVGVFQSFNSYLLPPILRRFHQLHPGIHVVVRQMPKRDMEERLVEGELDLGIAYEPAAMDKTEAEILFDEPLLLIVGREHPLHNRRKIRIGELHDRPLMLLTPEFPIRQVLDATLTEQGCRPRVVLETNSVNAILMTIKGSNLGTILAARLPQTIPGLHCIAIEPPIVRTAALFWRRDGHRSAAARVFGDMVRAAYADRDTTSKPAASRKSRRKSVSPSGVKAGS